MTIIITPSDFRELLTILSGTNEDGQKLDLILTKLEKLQMTDEQAKQVLDEINAGTNVTAANIDKLSANVAVIGTTVSTISNEMDTLIAKGTASGDISPAVADALTFLSERMGTVATSSGATSDALAAQVPVLEGVASKGAATPVPVTPVPVTIADPPAPGLTPVG